MGRAEAAHAQDGGAARDGRGGRAARVESTRAGRATGGNKCRGRGMSICHRWE
jgi:hypothetical protein